MTSLVQHLTQPQESEPDITHQEMLQKFSQAVISNEMYNPAMSTLYTEFPMENGDSAMVLAPDMRTLLFSDISKSHLERMIQIVCKDGIIGPGAVRAVLDGTTPSSIVEGVL